jgi:3-dehydroquinate dehydratase-2
LQSSSGETDGIIFNGAGYTHSSIALADTIAAIATPVVEVHISNIHAREEFRHKSYTASKAIGVITGMGLEGYSLAVRYFLDRH